MKSNGYNIRRSIALPLVLLLASQMFACSTSRYYLSPATDYQATEALGILYLSNARELSIDGNRVTDYDLVYMIPGWHFFEYGWIQDRGCGRWRVIKYVTRLGHMPVSEKWQCLEKRTDHVSFNGWYDVKAGDRLEWAQIMGKLKVSQSERDEVDDLEEDYRSDHVEVRRRTVERLGEIRNIRVVGILIKALDDEAPAVQIEACRSLGLLTVS